MDLTEEQLNNLARPLVGMLSVMENFFNDPQNESAYQKWYFEKYGRSPEDEVNQ